MQSLFLSRESQLDAMREGLVVCMPALITRSMGTAADGDDPLSLVKSPEMESAAGGIVRIQSPFWRFHIS
jgi:hypothetical protein